MSYQIQQLCLKGAKSGCERVCRVWYANVSERQTETFAKRGSSRLRTSGLLRKLIHSWLQLDTPPPQQQQHLGVSIVVVEMSKFEQDINNVTS